MGRTNRYETHVRPHLKDIRVWIKSLSEAQIAKKLGISTSALTNYKKNYPELLKALRSGTEELKEELKESLKMKAKGFTYEETRTIEKKDENGNVIGTTVETYKKYAPPDTGAIHLLLKNIDPNWKNDDDRTYELKKKQVEIAEKKADDANW